MSISEQRDPKTRKTYLLAEGKVDAVYINELKEVKTYSGPNGPWSPTHSINIVVDGVKIGLGLTDKQSVRAKDVDGQYQDVERGTEVSVVVEENGEYKGVTQYQGRVSGITVLEVAPKQQSEKSSGSVKEPYKPKDMSGVHTGHSINVAINVFGLAGADILIDAAKQAHKLTDSLRKEYAEKNPSMSEFDLGSMVGQSVLSASTQVDSIEDIEEYARITLDTVVPAVKEFVKSYGQEEAEEQKKPVAAKKVVKKTATIKKSELVAEEPSYKSDEPLSGVNSNDFDDFADLPF